MLREEAVPLARAAPRAAGGRDASASLRLLLHAVNGAVSRRPKNVSRDTVIRCITNHSRPRDGVSASLFYF